tara:strand:- start:1432 stop:2172 length:741 start_codon:yes stop_codon:yes gene_type:complete
MKKKNYLLILSIATMAISCGPSQEEIKAQEKRIVDSLEVVKQNSIKFENERKEFERIHLQKIEVGQSIMETNLSNIIDRLKVQLGQENAELSRINKFQWGRAQSTKNKELIAQQQKIDVINDNIRRLQKEKSMSKLFNSFDFQSSPRGTIEHLFYAAKNEDYSKVRHLLDPYGEYNSDARQICLVEMLPSDQKSEWKMIFENGRIMSDPIINENRAEVEVAIGANSNRLEKIKLIEHMGKWYILSL